MQFPRGLCLMPGQSLCTEESDLLRDEIFCNSHFEIWYRSLLKREPAKQGDCTVLCETFEVSVIYPHFTLDELLPVPIHTQTSAKPSTVSCLCIFIRSTFPWGLSVVHSLHLKYVQLHLQLSEFGVHWKDV